MPGSVEALALGRILSSFDRGVGLDVGCGHGRLAPTVVSRGFGYVGLDLDRGALRDAAVSCPSSQGASLVEANAGSMPFAEDSFSFAIMFRVYHRFANPEGVLRETCRVLKPGGYLVLLVMPRPSLFTFGRDLEDSLRRRKRGGSLTFSHQPRVEVLSGDHPGFVETLQATRERLEAAGLAPLGQWGLGLEDLPVFRRAPATFWLGLARLLPPGRFFPAVMIVARKGQPPFAPKEVRGPARSLTADGG